MYTQCSKCETIFKLSADVLRAAGGQVRCGRCGELFSALARLAEDASAFTPGESALELETRADSILESTVALKIAEAVAKDYEEYAPPGVEIARLQVLDWSEEDHAADMQDAAADAAADAADEAAEDAAEEAAIEEAAIEEAAADAAEAAEAAAAAADNDAAEPRPTELGDHSLEFTLPPGELDRIFVETKFVIVDPQMLPPHPESAAAAAAAAQVADGTDNTDGTDTIEAFNAPDGPQPPDSSDSAANATPTADSGAARGNAIGGLEVSEQARRDMLAGFEQPLEPQFDPRELRDDGSEGGGTRRRLALAAWLGAGVIAAALLMYQIGERNPEWPAVRALHRVLGTPIPQPVNLSAYQLRQWGVSGDPDASGTLRLRASILNAAPQLQPYPLLRVTLADRFGKRIGTRDFEPSEYLGKPAARQLAPGERVDAILNILDPGKNAEGFEIDVCLRGAERRIVCANDVAPQSSSAPGKR